MSQDKDDLAMQQAKHGSVVAFGEIVQRHQSRLVRFAARMCDGDLAAAEDIAQEAFLRLWRSRDIYRAEGKLASLLLKTVHHLCCDRARRLRPSDPIQESDAVSPGPEEKFATNALAEAVRDAVGKLPENVRAVFVLSVYEGLRYEEIADALEIPIGTVGSRKNHAVTILRARLKDWKDA